ncbi:MAG: hypothetical protein PHW27_10915 [Melioribacteraceae bacterium]|nr:hypothetical protein [Melioribacteraceae bacterium]MDD3559070.1 hypothetical protein [Melioribacteraceae bacterium]
MNRRGEKLGWTLGWLGGFLWVFIISIIFLIQGKYISGILAIVIFVTALLLIHILSPWRNKAKKYWLLMLPLYIIFIISIIVIIFGFGGINNLSEVQYGSWIIPCLVPIFVLGRKTWQDND